MKKIRLYDEKLEKLQRISGGAYGSVYKVKFKNDKDNKYYALKKISSPSFFIDGFDVSALREITILKELTHPNIEKIIDTFYNIDYVYILLEFVSCSLKELTLTLSDIKNIMHQLLSGVNYLHKNGVLHRDLKPENLMINEQGELKIIDFGLSRFISSPGMPMSKGVITSWYRPPEIFFGASFYSYNIDIWSVGCIFGYLLKKNLYGLKYPDLFSGESEIDTLTKIFALIGVPNDNNWPEYYQLDDYKVFEKGDIKTIKVEFEKCSSDIIDLLEKMLVINPLTRITAEDALKHPYFLNEPKMSSNGRIADLVMAVKSKDYAKNN